MTEPAVLAIDQGTGSTKVLVIDQSGTVRARGSAPLSQQAPLAGWVEQRPQEVLDSVRGAVADALSRGEGLDITAVGISNQRESLLLWERTTGRPVSPVLSWQDRRTIELCRRLVAAGHGDTVRTISGLPLDPMFSAVKAAWLLDEYDPDRSRSAHLALGTIDSWLAWNLTGRHVIEAGNASRTSLVDLATGDWSPELLELFAIPREVLPTVIDSVGQVGAIHDVDGIDGVPLTGILGDSHAALFAHAGWRPGVVKATYGTGSSVMTLVAPGAEDSSAMCRTIAWRLPGDTPALAWEANILSAGSTLTWLASVLGTGSSELAASAAVDSAGVALVPAFNGLGAPWWDPAASGVISGLSIGTTSGHLARAALDSVILQVSDVLDALATVQRQQGPLLVDGGMTSNGDLMSRQAALVDRPVRVSRTTELSALGAAHAAGLGVGLWTMSDLERLPRAYDEVDPASGGDPTALKAQWRDAIARARMDREDHSLNPSPTDGKDR